MADRQMDFEKALKEWQGLLGERVCIGESVQNKYGICTFPIKRSIPAALLPSTTDEVCECMRIANRYGIPVYPISTGHNWGYGSANPVIDQCVIIDLSQMNKIVEMDAKLGLVTLQPGVTQAQLSKYLMQEGYDFMVPVTGAGPTCSIVGNALERGYGITPYADHFNAVTSLKAVLADGTLYHSVHDSLGVKAISKVYKWGMGPYLDGLFAQSNFGIVTEMTIALAKRPEAIQAFFFSFTDSTMEAVVENVQFILSALGANIGGINLMNNRRIIAMRDIPYPTDKVAPNEIMPRALLDEICQQNKVPPWTGFGAIYAPKNIAKECQRIIKKQLRPHTRGLFFTSREKIQKLQNVISYFNFIKPLKKIHNILSVAEKGLAILNGIPSEAALKLAYWRSGKIPSAGVDFQPDKDQCGLIWYAPLIPMDANQVEFFIQLVERICAKYGIEPLITFSSLSNRCFDCTMPILFDPNNMDACARARKCYQELFQQGKEAGFFPYRLDVETLHELMIQENSYWKVVETLKKSIDLNNIIAPGRYAPYSFKS